MTQLKFNYPDIPGSKTTGTSMSAAMDMAQQAPLLRDRALALIRTRGPLTADEVAGHMSESVLTVRPRISELKRQGKIEDSGTRRLNNSGKMATCWREIL